MSVHSESLEITTPDVPREQFESIPELEYRAARKDSLNMFGAAIGGAVLGMLLTLLVLAMINGGTLSFSGGERLDALEATTARINENVGSVSTNVDIVAEQAALMQAQLGTLESTLTSELATVNESIVVLEQTRSQFDAFIGAMTSALNEVNAMNEPTDGGN